MKVSKKSIESCDDNLEAGCEGVYVEGPHVARVQHREHCLGLNL
jgi:hypothetical protein